MNEDRRDIFLNHQIKRMQKPHHAAPQSIKTILFAWLLCGSLDIIFAFADYYIKTGKGPEGVLKYIASGIFGKQAFGNNATMIWLGLLFHFFIALVFTLLFFILYPRIKLLQVNVLITAIIIGLIVWAIMNFIVLPLSNTPKSTSGQRNLIKPLLVLICMIGLPLSIVYKRHFKTA